jgi:hypothetical protein
MGAKRTNDRVFHRNNSAANSRKLICILSAVHPPSINIYQIFIAATEI